MHRRKSFRLSSVSAELIRLGFHRFLIELEAFHDLCDAGRSDEVDPLFIGLLLMVRLLFIPSLERWADSLHALAGHLRRSRQHSYFSFPPLTRPDAVRRTESTQRVHRGAASSVAREMVRSGAEGAHPRRVGDCTADTNDSSQFFGLFSPLHIADGFHFLADHRPLHSIPPTLLIQSRSAGSTGHMAGGRHPTGSSPRSSPARLQPRDNAASR